MAASRSHTSLPTLVESVMKFGLTSHFPCSYLPDREERLLVHVGEAQEGMVYDKLIQAGFRRSGEQMYRPHCARCNECKAIRINIAKYTPSRSQKRLINKNKDLNMLWRASEEINLTDYFPLYADYISERHRDGSMFPPDLNSFLTFNQCAWRQPYFLEAWLDNRLVAVAITDKMANGLSAFYTFFAPDLDKRSLGGYMILAQINQALQLELPYLYLGYYINQCDKMNYKTQYSGYEWFNGEYWSDESLTR